MLYFGRRGRENQRNMVKEDIVLWKTANGLECISLLEWATRNQPGGFRDYEDNSQALICEWPDYPKKCPVRCIKKYLEKANPKLPRLMPKPRNYSNGKFNESDAVWDWNVPLEKKKNLDNLLCRIGKKAGLSTLFTSHCIRATSVTMRQLALRTREWISVTGHKSDTSIESYHERLILIQQQVQSLAIVNSFVVPGRASQANAPLSAQCHRSVKNSS